MRRTALVLVLAAAACATTDEPPPPEPMPPVVEAPTPPAATAETPPELPFDPSPDDKAALGDAGYTGTVEMPADSGYGRGCVLAGVKPGGPLERAGVKAGDVIVALGGMRFPLADDDPIGALRRRLLELPFDSETTVALSRKGEPVREVTVRLGRRPPPMASLTTPPGWLAGLRPDATLRAEIDRALALDDGAARFADVLGRQRKHLAKTDVLRLPIVAKAHMQIAANEREARALATGAMRDGTFAFGALDEGSCRVEQFRGLQMPLWNPRAETIEGLLDEAAGLVLALDELARAATAEWTAEERAFVAAAVPLLTERLEMNEYLYDDEKPARERSNRRLVKLLAKVDVCAIHQATELLRDRAGALVGAIAELAGESPAPGLLASRDTLAGRIEIWGSGSQRHTARCAFRVDLGGDDLYVENCASADLAHPVSINADMAGDDVYMTRRTFDLGSALGGIAALIDAEGDDRYEGIRWTQGAAVAGAALLHDRSGDDVYRAQFQSQGIGLRGLGVLRDTEGADSYLGARFCQGVGFPGGIGMLLDTSGDDRYACGFREDSEYGDPGETSGWGQGCGFGFRGIASGGIGVLHDRAGNDRYDAGTFSQGGGYFYAWGILLDGSGDDDYVGSRYAQGFAAHQAVGTFLDDAGDDVYRCRGGVAQGLSWDETSVFFRDRAGNDRYLRFAGGGFSLASAAMNGMVVFLDDAGDDEYDMLPAHAAQNTYHGGNSFALFRDGGGRDRYAGSEKENGTSAAREDGAYFIDD